MQGFRRTAVHFALVAMLLRALLPVGWMPNLAGGGDTFLVACSADGLLQNTDQHHQDRQAPGNGQQSHDECPFAAAPHIASPTTAAQVALPTYFGHFSNSPRAAAAVFDVSAYQPQSPRAPPFFS